MLSQNYISTSFLLAAIIFLQAFASHAESELPLKLESIANFSTAQKIEALKKMGWNIRFASGESKLAASSEVCDSEDIKDFEANLLLKVDSAGKENISESDLQLIDRALESNAQLCLYQKRINAAVAKVTKKFNDSYLYWFQMPWSSRLVWLGNMQKYWQADPNCKNQCFLPKEGRITESLHALGQNFFTSDCAVALQLTELSVIQEVFGVESFRQNFAPEEIVIGEWSDVRKSKSFMRGNDAKRLNLRQGFAYAEAGFQTMVGISGYVGSRFDESFLDSKTSRNQNFVITKTSKRALQELDLNQGLSYYSRLAEEVWQLSKKMSFSEIKAIEELAYWNQLEGATESQIAEAVSSEAFVNVSKEALQVAKILSSTFLIDTKVYVHPLGIKSLSWHIAHLLRINPRTPYGVFLYQDAIHGESYQRWIQSQLREAKKTK